MDGALGRLARRGTPVASVIDVGASTGIWSARAMRYFPAARYMLVEAQPVHEPALRRFTRQHRNATHLLVAAGDREGTVNFELSEDPFGGRASHDHLGGQSIQVPVRTLDAIADEQHLPAPYCIKLDTHGFELAILHGAARMLQRTSCIVMECYAFRFADNLLFPEMCRHMDGLGFRCIDIVDNLYRPRDGAFWQADLVFVPNAHAAFDYNQYQ